MVARISALAAAVFAFTGCGASHQARPGLRDCVVAWNSFGNAERRALVAGELVPAGYTKAGIQMVETLGAPRNGPDPNPVGCRVVLFRSDRWVAYLARRDGAGFAFATHLPAGRDSDERGAWPKTGFRLPNNAEVVVGGGLLLK
jgi:hypothetical protein